MKNAFISILMLTQFFAFTACVSDDKNDENGVTQNYQGKLTISCEALDITMNSAIFTGYANLPFGLGIVEVGVLYDTDKSFQNARKIVVTDIDSNKKFTVSATGLSPGTTYYYKSYVQKSMDVQYSSVESFTTQEIKCPAGSVDLGIVMPRGDGTTYKLFWATSNLCESGLCAKPEDYGDYFAWGETSTKSDYSWLTYKFRTSGDFYDNVKLSKYVTNSTSYGTIDNKTVLDQEDDVAHVKLGGNWRMPTYTEWMILKSECTSTWTTQNGVKGLLFTATNGKSIFLPASGYMDGRDHGEAGSTGEYWSSSLSNDFPSRAWSFFFDSYEFGSYNGAAIELRYGGLSVRPVTE